MFLCVLSMNAIYIILTSRFLTQDLTRKRRIETYPAAEPDALVDIVPVGVVVPLDAV